MPQAAWPADANSVTSELDCFRGRFHPLDRKCPTNAVVSTFKASTPLLGLKISPTSSKGSFFTPFSLFSRFFSVSPDLRHIRYGKLVRCDVPARRDGQRAS